MSKYNNKREKADGYTFDSQAEYRRYGELKILEKAGEIQALKVHPRYTLFDEFWFKHHDLTPVRLKPITYVGDFEYIEDGRRVCEDVKGVQTDVFKLKANIFLRRYTHIELRIVPA